MVVALFAMPMTAAGCLDEAASGTTTGPDAATAPALPSLDALTETLALSDDQRSAVGSALTQWGAERETSDRRGRAGGMTFLKSVAPALTLPQTGKLIAVMEESRPERANRGDRAERGKSGKGRREGHHRKMTERASLSEEERDARRADWAEKHAERMAEHAERRAEFLTVVLKLDSGQTVAVEKALAEELAAHQELRRSARGEDADREAMRQKGRELRASSQATLRALLSPEQQTVFDTMEAAGHKRWDRRGRH
jgi:hypothetical protein